MGNWVLVVVVVVAPSRPRCIALRCVLCCAVLQRVEVTQGSQPPCNRCLMLPDRPTS